MEDIQPLRNFLKDIQGQPDLIYTQEAVDNYNRLKEQVLQAEAACRQQDLQQQVLKKIDSLQALIREYEREINEANEFLGAVMEYEKKHLVKAFHRIRKTEQEVQQLLAQVC